jgi:hypothetical protein
MGRLWWVPGPGVHVTLGPSIEPSRGPLRVPVIEQFATQLGGAFARDARPLLARELDVARPIFEDSIAYEAVRVVTGYFVNAPTTLGNHVRISPDRRFDDSTLVHELTHVWQFQSHGTGYISNSVCAQLSGVLRGEGRDAAYEIRPSELNRVSSFYELSAERQARVVEFYFVGTLLRHSDPMQRHRARSEFWYLVQDMADPGIDEAKFNAEFADLERMIVEVRRAHPIGAAAIYQESLHDPSSSNQMLDASQNAYSAPHTMPFIRVDF